MFLEHGADQVSLSNETMFLEHGADKLEDPPLVALKDGYC